MVVIAGCVIVKNNKILMVKEAKKKCYGQWSFPGGHVEENELITDAAIREVYEETGCKVKLTGVLPISTVYLKEKEKSTKKRRSFSSKVLYLPMGKGKRAIGK